MDGEGQLYRLMYFEIIIKFMFIFMFTRIFIGVFSLNNNI